MDITFETESGTNFTIAVVPWDTIAEVKEKVQNYKQIPVSQQTLVFQDRVLHDDLDILEAELVHGSRVSLIIAANNEQSPISRRIQIVLRHPPIAPVEINLDDTVETLKHKISEKDGGILPINRIVLHEPLAHTEMQDSKKIRDYNLTDGSEVYIRVKRDNNAQLSSTTVPASPPPQYIPPVIPSPQFTSPEIPLPQLTWPDMPLPQFTSPVMLPPQFTSPEMLPPQFTSPEIPLHQFTSPEMPLPQFTLPEMPLPQFTLPEMPLPQFTSPVMPTQFTSLPISRRIQILLRAPTGQTASLDIDLDDTVERLKHKINEREGASVPINCILLREPLSNIEMQDRQKIRDYNLTDGSEVGISVKPASELSTAPTTMAQLSPTAAPAMPQQPISRRIQILFKPHPGRRQMAPMEIDVDDTVERLKHKIKEREGTSVPINRIILREPLGLVEMKDSDKIREYHLRDGTEVIISVKPASELSTPQAKLPTSPATMASSSTGKLRVNVKRHQEFEIWMEFNATDKVQVIRRELHKIKEFKLPQEYFFIHKEGQRSMTEDKSFLWHGVRQGDTISLHGGRVFPLSDLAKQTRSGS